CFDGAAVVRGVRLDSCVEFPGRSADREPNIRSRAASAHVRLMIHLPPVPETFEAAAPVASRAGLARLMRRTCAEIGAERYILVQPSFDRGPKAMRIITSNWIFDALEDFGSEGIGKIIESGNACAPGAVPRPLMPATALFLDDQERRAMREHGHAELYCQKLNADGVAIFALFSAETPRLIDAS